LLIFVKISAKLLLLLIDPPLIIVGSSYNSDGIDKIDLKVLYSVPYQHFTNSIENFFSMLKSILNKLAGLTHKDLTTNLKKVIRDIPKEKYENIISGAYKRPEKYVKKTSNRVRKLKEYLCTFKTRRFKCAKV